MCETIQSSFVPNNLQLETIQMCINFRMDEQFSVNPCNVNNGKELVLCITIWELLMDMMINRKNGYKGIHSISLHLYDAQAYGQPP